MKNKAVETVAKDIRELLVGVKTGTHKVSFDSPELLTKYGLGTVRAFRKSLSYEGDRERPLATFYASEVGTKCPRQLWYKYHRPKDAEPFSASVSMKFLYGGLIEETVLKLAEIAGHKVEYEQELVEYTYNGITIRGRCDAVIDSAVVDVKSVNSYGFKDFQQGKGGDKFGYAAQLEFYSWRLSDAGKCNPTKMGYLVIDKQLGHIEYCPEHCTTKVDWTPIWKNLENIVVNNKQPPFNRLPTVTEGSNEKLGLECSYCAWKKTCWDPVANGGKGLRAFKYSNGITWLAQVNKEPKVPEITDKVIADGGDN